MGRRQWELKPIVRDYFSTLFTSEVREPDESLLAAVRPSVMPAMNDLLTAPYTSNDYEWSSNCTLY